MQGEYVHSSVDQKLREGMLYSVVHAGNETGFIERAVWYFPPNTQYMIAVVSRDTTLHIPKQVWLTKKMFPKHQVQTVTLMDNALNRSVQVSVYFSRHVFQYALSKGQDTIWYMLYPFNIYDHCNESFQVSECSRIEKLPCLSCNKPKLKNLVDQSQCLIFR